MKSVNTEQTQTSFHGEARSARRLSGILLGLAAALFVYQSSPIKAQCCGQDSAGYEFTCYLQAESFATPNSASVTGRVDGRQVADGQRIMLCPGWHTVSYDGVHGSVGDTTGISVRHLGSCGTSKIVMLWAGTSGSNPSGFWVLESSVSVSLSHGLGDDYYDDDGSPIGKRLDDPHVLTADTEFKRFYVISAADTSLLDPGDGGGDGGDGGDDGGDGGGSGGGSPSDSSGGDTSGGSATSSATFSLGTFADGQSAGWLTFSADASNPDSVSLASVDVFEMPYEDDYLAYYKRVMLRDGDQIRQVLTEQMLADVQQGVGAHAVVIRYYLPEQLVCDADGNPIKVAGYYAPSTNAEVPFKEIRIQSGDLDPSASVTRPGVRYETYFKEGQATPQLVLSHVNERSAVIAGDGSVSRLVMGNKIVETTESVTGNDRTVSRRVLARLQDDSEVEKSSVIESWHKFSWGRDEKIQEVRQTGGTSETTLYDYYEFDPPPAPGAAGEANYARLKSRINPDGTWEMHEYESDGTERIYTGWQGLAAPADPASIPKDGSKIGTSCRTLVRGPSLLMSGHPSAESEFILGTPVKTITTTEWGGVTNQSGQTGVVGVTVTTTAAGMSLVETSYYEPKISLGRVTLGERLTRMRSDGLYEFYEHDYYTELPDSDLVDEDGTWDVSHMSPHITLVIPTVDGELKLEPGKTMRSASYTSSGPFDDFSVTINWVWGGAPTAFVDAYSNHILFASDTDEPGWKQISISASDTPSDYEGKPTSTTRIAINHAGVGGARRPVTYHADYTYTGVPGRQVRTAEIRSADGSHVTETQSESAGVTTSIQEGYPASLATPIGADVQPDITTTSTTATNSLTDLTTTVRTVAGGGAAPRAWSSSETTDALGHVVQTIDEVNRVVTRRHLPADATRGVQEIENFPGDADVDGQRGRVTEYYRDGRLKSITGTRVVAEHHSYSLDTESGNTMQLEVEEVRYGTAMSPRFKRTARNALGRVMWEEAPNPSDQQGQPAVVRTTYAYNEKGQMTGIQRPGMAPQIIEYDEAGRQVASGYDLDVSEVLEREGADPVTETETTYETSTGGSLWEVHTRRTYHTEGSADVLTSIRKQKLNTGRDSETITISPDGSKVKETTVVDWDNRSRTVTRKSYRPGDAEADAITTTQTWANGLLVAETIPGLGDAQPLRFHYDALRRLVKTTDPRTTTGQRSYLGDGRVEWEGNAAGERTAYVYYYSWPNQLDVIMATGHDGSTRVSGYDLHGRLARVTGTGAYAQSYAYDPVYGELISSVPAVMWGYQERTGKLRSRTDGVTTTIYAYRTDGRLLSRTSHRTVIVGGSAVAIKTTYGYDTMGRLTGITYNDGTPSVSFQYDRAGRQLQVGDASGVRNLAYQRSDGTVSAEDYAADGGLLASLRVEHVQADPHAETPVKEGAVLKRGGAALAATHYDRDPVRGGLAGVSFESAALNGSAVHDWSTSARGLPGRLSYAGAAGLELSRSEELGEGLKRMTVKLKRTPSGQELSATQMEGPYLFRNTASMKWKSTSVRDGVSWTYLFNNRMEVSGAGAALASRTQPDAQGQTAQGQPPLASFSEYYNYDGIGNRTQVEQYGDGLVLWGHLRKYTPNGINQYTQISRPDGDTKILLGTASEHAHVRAWLSSGVADPTDLVLYRVQRPQDDSGHLGFIAGVTAGAATTPMWKELNVTAEHKGPNPPAGGTMTHRKGYLYLPPKTETLAYDDDGNLTDDARWKYAWDAENRMKSAETQTTAAAVGVPQQRLAFTYDSQHRRVRKKVETFSTTTQTWSVTTDRRFVYDGWNMIAEFEASPSLPVSSSPRLLRSYAWGLDMSGTTQGAGGVGGLVSVTEYDSNGNATRMLAPAYDTNGNIMAYADIATGAVTHRFEYDAFGVALTVSYADGTEAPPFRFSTKYLDEETGLYYYGFRYYSPELGRWLNRDPIGERGGINLYGMVGNDPVNRWDLLGQSTPMGHLAPYLWPGLADKPDHFPDSVWEAVFGSQEFKDYLSSLEKIAERNAQVLRTTTAKGPGMNAHIHVQDTQGMDFLQKAHATVIAGGIDVEVTKNHEIKINCEWSRPPRCGCVATSTLYVYISDNYGFGDYSGDQNGNWGNTALKWLSAVPSLGGAQNYTLTDNREYQWTYGFSPK